MGTGIEYLDESWNPFQDVRKGKNGRGYHCTKVSEGCVHCWAEEVNRIRGNGLPFDSAQTKLEIVKKTLLQPLKWERPRIIGVQFMGDLFHDSASWPDIDRVLAVAALCPQHTFIILSKRPITMWYYFHRPTHRYVELRAYELMKDLEIKTGTEGKIQWPLPNVIGMVTVETMERAKERVPVLLQCPFAFYGVSVEPMLEEMSLLEWLKPVKRFRDNRLTVVLCGGESGRDARAMHPKWPRNLRNECMQTGAEFVFKQWGEYCAPSQMPEDTYREWDIHHGTEGWDRDEPRWRVGKKAAGRMLDGRIHNGLMCPW